MEPVNIDDLRVRARRRLPKVVFDFIDGGAQDERTLAANRADFARIQLLPKVLVDVSQRTLATTVLGRPIAMPLLLAPTGVTGLATPRGEIHAARAAEAAGIPYVLSTTATSSIEDVRGATSAPFWFQLYVMRDRALTQSMVERAKAAGCGALVLTADLPVQGRRERDVRNGFTLPPRVTHRNLLEVLARPRWLWNLVTGPALAFGNFPMPGGFVSIAQHIAAQHDASVSWRDIEWMRGLWGGPFVVKGVLRPDDARRAVDAGADAVIVSNHGGRQIDGVPSSISTLPDIAAAIGDRAEILMDGGIRRGSDIVKALALGARAVLVGRPFLYGLGALGPRGAGVAIEMLRSELDNALALVGAPSVAALDRSFVRVMPAGAAFS
jgi:L-lactate dehydrogenase (cytochrome)